MHQQRWILCSGGGERAARLRVRSTMQRQATARPGGSDGPKSGVCAPTDQLVSETLARADPQSSTQRAEPGQGPVAVRQARSPLAAYHAAQSSVVKLARTAQSPD